MVGFIKRIIRKLVRDSVPELSVLRRGLGKGILDNYNHNVIVGKSVKIYSPSYISETEIGDFSYISQNAHISMTRIGKFCSIGPGLVCGWGIHPITGLSTHPMFYSTKRQNGMTLSTIDKVTERKPIIIGNDVFIGANVTILDGVTIGNGAVIGAGAVVSKNIPPYAIAVGCPMQINNFRFSSKQIDELQRIKWWEFDEERLKDVEKWFFDVDGFIEAYHKESLGNTVLSSVE